MDVGDASLSDIATGEVADGLGLVRGRYISGIINSCFEILIIN
jgi:hypothetical protein